MKLPPIGFVRTNDDVSLAYAVLGEGPPLMYAFAGPALSNFEHEWNHGGLVEQYEAMARERTVIRFDWRNCGVSTRHVADVSPDAHLRDLLALQDHLGFEHGCSADTRQRVDRAALRGSASGTSFERDSVEPVGDRRLARPVRVSGWALVDDRRADGLATPCAAVRHQPHRVGRSQDGMVHRARRVRRCWRLLPHCRRTRW